MKRLAILMLGLTSLLISESLKAQLNAGNEGIYIRSGTIFSTEGLAITPSSDLSINNLTIVKGADVVGWPQYNSITRAYHLSSPLVFRGTLAVSYQNSELNGNNAAFLALAYSSAMGSNDYKDYLLSNGCIISTEDRYVKQIFEGGLTFSDLTAVTAGSVIPAVVASSSTSFCEGSSVTLSTVQASSWQWYRDGALLPGSTNRDLQVSQSGDYSVQVTFANSITSLSDPVSVTVSPMPSAQLISDKGNTISLGDIATLTASGGTTYLWENTDGIVSGQNTSTLTVRPSKNTTYRVIISNGGACNAVETIDISVANDYKSLVPYNMVTPNGDGVNDVWLIKNIDMYPNNELKIFDRAGRVVYSKNGYDNTWDATLNGVALPEDTYYYVLYIDSGKGKLTGFISVVKK